MQFDFMASNLLFDLTGLADPELWCWGPDPGIGASDPIILSLWLAQVGSAKIVVSEGKPTGRSRSLKKNPQFLRCCRSPLFPMLARYYSESRVSESPMQALAVFICAEQVFESLMAHRKHIHRTDLM
jgi:hypothetical protein